MKLLRLLSLLALIFPALGVTADAADFAFTINWDTPDAVTIHKGTGDSEPLAIPSGATSFTGTESGDTYWIKPAPGHILTRVNEKMTVNGKPSDKDLKLNGNERYGQFVSKFIGSAHNDAVYTVTTKSLSPAGELTLDVQNGIGKFDAWFKNTRSGEEEEMLSTFRKLTTLVKGEQSVAFTEHENYLNIYPNGMSKIYRVELNGEAMTEAYGGYELPVKAGDKIMIRVSENNPESRSVTMKFTNGVCCLSDVYNHGTGKFIMADALADAGYKLTVEDGERLTFHFNEDYEVTGLRVNGKSEQLPSAGYTCTVSADTELEFTATEKVYEDIAVTLYLKNGEGVVVRKGPFAEDEIIPRGDGEALDADITLQVPAASGSSTVPFTISKNDTKKYVINVPGKTAKYFWDAMPGYWITASWLFTEGKPAAETPMPGVDADGKALYLEATAIDTSRRLLIFFDGAEKEGKFLVKNSSAAGYLPLEGLGEESYLPVGYTLSSYDPSYHQTFSAGKVGAPEDKAFQVFVNGQEIKASDDGSFALPVSGDPAIVKIFSRDARVVSGELEVTDEVRKPVINFEVTEGCSAGVTYDKICGHTDLSAPLNLIGKTLVSIRPVSGTHVFVDDEEITPDSEGNCEFWTGEKRRHTVRLSDSASGVGETDAAAGEDAPVHNLQGIEVGNDLDALPAGIYIRNGKKIVK